MRHVVEAQKIRTSYFFMLILLLNTDIRIPVHMYTYVHLLCPKADKSDICIEKSYKVIVQTSCNMDMSGLPDIRQTTCMHYNCYIHNTF